MKKLITIGCFCILSLCLFAQTDSLKGPRVTFLIETVDYGTIEFGSDGYRDFQLYNTGDSPLFISNCKASCSCTIVEYHKEAILPGKGTSIRIKYDTSLTGQFVKQISIESNDPTGTKTINIIGIVNLPAINSPH